MRRRPFPTVLVGQSSLLREGLSQILCAGGFRVVASGASVHDLTGSLAKHQSIILVIDSSSEPGTATEQIKLFKEQIPASRVAVLMGRHRLADILSAFQAGANACFVKAITRDAFIKALELVMLGETILPPELLPYLRDSNTEDEHVTVVDEPEIALLEPTLDAGDYALRLSPREKSILRYIAQGASNKVIARIIQVTEATVKVHVKAILRKVRVHNRTQAAIWAVANSSSIWSAEVAPGVAAMDHPTPLASGSPQPSVLVEPNPAKSGVALTRIDGRSREGHQQQGLRSSRPKTKS